MAVSWKSECRIAAWRRCTLTVCAFLSLMLAWAVQADSGVSSSDFMVSGFGTAGVVSAATTEPWLFRRDQSEPGGLGGRTNALTDSRFGVQVNYQFNPQWEVVGQAVWSRVEGDAPLSQYLQWAFLSYKPIRTLTLRVGRTSPDLFLLSDYRDVGFAYPWVRPNTEFYGWLPNKFIDGFDATEAWYLDSALWKARVNYGRGATKAPDAQANIPGLAGSPNTPLAGNGILTLDLTREQGGLTAKLSFFLSPHQTLELPQPQFMQLQQGLQQLQQTLLQLGSLAPADVLAQNQTLVAGVNGVQNVLARYLSLGLQYDHGPWLLQSEISRISGTRLAGSYSLLNAWHWYESLGYRIGPVTAYSMYGRSLPRAGVAQTPTTWASELAPLFGSSNAAAAQLAGDSAATLLNGGRIDQRSVSLGLRWDLSSQVDLKLQWDNYHVYPNGAGLWGNGTPEAGYANVYSLALDFMF